MADAAAAVGVPKKRIAIKRDVDLTNVVIKRRRKDGNSEDETEKLLEKKSLVELKTVSADDKIQARANRFGGFQSDQAKIAARARRFSDHLGEKTSSPAASDQNLETLKKRSERFGVSSSSLMKQVDQSEVRKKRAERFGPVATGPETPSSNKNTEEEIQKKKDKLGT